MTKCTRCEKTVDDKSFDDDYEMCIACLKIERGKLESHVDACTKCGIAFDVSKFTWRKDAGAWRKTCTTCTAPASTSAAYRKRLREKDEEGFKEARRNYMREWNKKKKLLSK